MIAQGLNLYAYDVNCCPKCVTEEETAAVWAGCAPEYYCEMCGELIPAKLVSHDMTPPRARRMATDAELRQIGLRCEDDALCGFCGLAEMDGAFPVCKDCEACATCGCRCKPAPEPAGMKAFLLNDSLIIQAPDEATVRGWLEKENAVREAAWKEWQESAASNNLDDMSDPSADMAYHKTVKAFKERYGNYPWAFRPFVVESLACLKTITLPPVSPTP